MNVCTNCIYNTCCGTVRETCEGRHTIAQAKRELKAAKESGDKKAINIYTALLERTKIS